MSLFVLVVYIRFTEWNSYFCPRELHFCELEGEPPPPLNPSPPLSFVPEWSELSCVVKGAKTTRWWARPCGSWNQGAVTPSNKSLVKLAADCLLSSSFFTLLAYCTALHARRRAPRILIVMQWRNTVQDYLPKKQLPAHTGSGQLGLEGPAITTTKPRERDHWSS